MAELTTFLEGELRLKVNRDKSAVSRPWERKFLGYSFTWHKQTHIRIAPSSLERLKARVRELVRIGPQPCGDDRRTGSCATRLDVVLPAVRRTGCAGGSGWVDTSENAPHPVASVEAAVHACVLQKKGLSEERAWRSATNQRGPWWNAGARHMNEACPNKWFSLLDLVLLLDSRQSFQCV
nr:hypothetical protein [Pseudogulbenkiania sp. MAI-1]